MPQETKKVIEVDAMANMHSHLREHKRVMASLIRLAVAGGIDCILPMPNTDKGLLTAREVLVYEADLRQSCLESGNIKNFVPTVMLNERTSIEIMDECVDAGILDGKVYPLDRTTKSHNGVRHYASMLARVRHCGKQGMRVHLHPEHPWMLFDNRDAEFVFLPIVEMFLQETEATIIWEHGTDARCIPFWKEFAKSGRFFLTLTAHHLASDEDQSFGDVRAVCKPPIKTRRDRQDLMRLVGEDHDWVMAGLDDAPHDNRKKHPPQGGCACGAFTSPFGHQLYAHALDELLSRAGGEAIYQRFTSRNARKRYGLPEASYQVRLEKKPFVIPQYYPVGDGLVEPFWALQEVDYSLEKI